MGAADGRAYRRLGSWVVLIVGVAIVAVWWSSRGAVAQEADELGNAELGAQLYALNCAQCHASDGSGAIVPGTDREAPALVDRPSVTAAYMDLVMRTGRMPPAADPFDNQPRQVVLDEEQRSAIVAYTVQRFGLEDDIPEVEEGDAGNGQSVYAQNCAACHGSTGAGGVAGGGAWTPSVYEYDAVTIAEAIRVGPFQMPAFGPDQLTDQEVGDIAAFLEEVRGEEGTPLGLVELNPVYASGFVALLAVAMILSLFWISSKPSWFPDPEGEDDGATGDTRPRAAPDLTGPSSDRGGRSS